MEVISSVCYVASAISKLCRSLHNKDDKLFTGALMMWGSNDSHFMSSLWLVAPTVSPKCLWAESAGESYPQA